MLLLGRSSEGKPLPPFLPPSADRSRSRDAPPPAFIFCNSTPPSFDFSDCLSLLRDFPFLRELFFIPELKGECW